MKVLLMAMPDSVPHFNPKAWKPPSLALTSIAGNMDKHHDVYIADLILRRSQVRKTVIELIEQYEPDIVGLSAMSFQFDTARHVAELIKDIRPLTKIAIGGYHATLMYKEIADSKDGNYFDFLVRGEGDLSFGELVNTIEEQRPLNQVEGISYKENGSFVHNAPRKLEDIENIKLPDRSKRIWNDYCYYFKQLDVIESSRGCTMPCNFCSMNHMYGRTFRAFPTERVIADIANAKEYGADYLVLADDNITLDVERFMELCDAIVEAGHNDIGYIVQVSSAGISSTPLLAQKMARAGLNIAFLGIENVSEHNLKHMRKGNIIEKTRKAVQYLHENNIMIVGGMIVGLPDDSQEDIRQNFEFFREMEIDFYGDQIITPYPKTSTREEMLQAGLVTDIDNFKRYNGYWSNVKTKYLSQEDIQFLRWKYGLEFSTFYHTTPVFKANFPFVNLLRIFYRRPYVRLRNFIRSMGQTEKESFRADMKRIWQTNVFF